VSYAIVLYSVFTILMPKSFNSITLLTQPETGLLARGPPLKLSIKVSR